VLDDCSTDDSVAVARRLAAADPRVLLRAHATNHGHIATYNEGFAWASADYVLLISADDLLTPGAPGAAINLLETHPNAVFAYGEQVPFSDRAVLPQDAAQRAAAPAEHIEGRAFIGRLCGAAENPVATPTVIVRNAAQRRAGDYMASLPHTADLEMWLRLALLGDAIRLPRYQAFKRRHGSNMQNAYVHRAIGDFVERREAFLSFLDGPAVAEPERSEWMRQANAALARQAVWRAALLFDDGSVSDAGRLLAYAGSWYPDIRQEQSWKRMQLKRRLGPRIWRLVRPVVDGLRGRT
jgi:glycosyltransferase involved in cell wall biosynthesis